MDFCAREKLHLITTKKYELRTFDVLEIELVESFKREKIRLIIESVIPIKEKQ